MKIVLATSNEGKVKELKQMLAGYDVYALSSACEPFDIVENGDSFAQNALIKARAVFERLGLDKFKQNEQSLTPLKGINEEFFAKDVVVLSDDSGISVDILGGAPGIFSARYADGSEAGNRAHLAKELSKASQGLNKQALSLQSTTNQAQIDKMLAQDVLLKDGSELVFRAHYTACVAICSVFGEYYSYGFMHGFASQNERGSGGFGYDSMFMPAGFDKTIAQLSPDIKQAISHRAKAIEAIMPVLAMLKKRLNQAKA